MNIATNVERSYFPPAEALLRKAYASLGLKVEFLAWPLSRAHVELRSGRIDAVAMRAEAYFDQAPFLRKVDVPLLNLHVYAYGRPPCPNALPAEELAKRRISHQRGHGRGRGPNPRSLAPACQHAERRFPGPQLRRRRLRADADDAVDGGNTRGHAPGHAGVGCPRR